MKFVVILFLLLIVLDLKSQPYIFDQIGTKDGLSQNDVNDIYQDRNGFLWIATHDGLNRYDGYSFKTYRIFPDKKNSLSSNLIYGIVEDKNGNLWIATTGEGICKFNIKKEEFTVYKNTQENSDLLRSNYIGHLLALRDGSIWSGSDNGIDIIEPQGDKYVVRKLDLDPNERLNNVNDMAEDSRGRKWICTREGLYIFSDENEAPLRLQPEVVFLTIYIKGDQIFVANSTGVYQVLVNEQDLRSTQFRRVSWTIATDLLLDSSGDLYIGTNQGLVIYQRNKQNRDAFKIKAVVVAGVEHNNISNNVVKKLFEDRSGIIWCGTKGGGINKYNPKRKKFEHFTKTRQEGSLSGAKIQTIFEDSQQNIWIGTIGAGLNYLPASDHRDFNAGFQYVDVAKGSIQNDVSSIAEVGTPEKPEILAGIGYSKLIAKISVRNGHVLDEELGGLSKIDGLPFAILKDRKGNLWVGTYGVNGLYKYTKDEYGEKLVSYTAEGTETSLPSPLIRSLAEDKNGNLWIGTAKGLSLLTPEEQLKDKPSFKTFHNDENDPKSISYDYILPIYQSKDGTIWIGTLGGGLNKMNYHSNPDSIAFERITTKDGLSNNVIKAILEDDYGCLWISSNKGLTRYNMKSKQVTNFGMSDGLQDYEFSELSCCKLQNGQMLFGGVNGINAFYPEAILKDLSVPIVALTDFQILNNSVPVGGEIGGRVVLQNAINHTEALRLRHSENSFSFYFSCLHFAAPRQNSYKYILEGVDKDWIYKDAGERVATYTNLSPGTYIFKVMASNSDGILCENQKEVKIVILPPWWFSKIAIFIYALLFAVGIWFFRRYSLIKIQHKNELLMEHFEKEKIQELSQVKLRFFTNISHEFRTPLTLIIGPLERLIEQGASVSQQKLQESHQLMHRNASVLLRLINQLIDFRKLEQGKMKLRATNSDLIVFLRDVFESFNMLAENKGITYRFSTTSEEFFVWFDKEKLESIIFNLLSNAFKYTKEGGEVTLDVSEEQGYAVIQVIDNGIGIPASMQGNIFQRFYQAERIENLKNSTGIGLSYTKGLVEVHKGEISFTSIEGVGTTFTLKLRTGDNHLTAEEKRENLITESENREENLSYLEIARDQDADQRELADAKGKSQKVLVVEDNYELRNFINESLAEEYEVYMAEDGKDGLEKALKLSPHVIVSDIMMPEKNGYELCEAIKTNKQISHTPVILLTAKSDAESQVKGYYAGADSYIPKPFNMAVLQARIKNLIESREKLIQKFRASLQVEPAEVTTTSADEKLLTKMLEYVEKNISNPDLKVGDMAYACHMTQAGLNKKLKALTGLNANFFIRSIRLKRAAQLLATGNYFVSDVAYEVGFSNLKYFRKCFQEEFGMIPTEYIKTFKNRED